MFISYAPLPNNFPTAQRDRVAGHGWGADSFLGRGGYARCQQPNADSRRISAGPARQPLGSCGEHALSWLIMTARLECSEAEVATA